SLERLFYERVFKRMNERAIAAAAWFLERLEGNLAELKEHIHEQDGKTKVKKYITDLKLLLQVIERKKELLERSLALTHSLALAGNIREAMSQFLAPVVATSAATITPKEEKPVKKKGASKLTSLELYQSGKNIEEIAKERGLAA